MGKFDFAGTTDRDLSSKKYSGRSFPLDSIFLSLILIAVKQEPEIICQLVETIRKMVITPVIVLLPDHSEMRNKIIQSGADVVLTQLCIEEISLQAYALIRRYTEWKSERKEEIPVMVGKLEIFPLQRTVEWEHKRIPVVKREFDFLYLLASTPGRVYTYSQIYQLVWQEYPHGDITNIIYCMVHRLKRKLKNVDVNAEHIIISVKEVGYCLKNIERIIEGRFPKWSLLFVWEDFGGVL